MCFKFAHSGEQEELKIAIFAFLVAVPRNFEYFVQVREVFVRYFCTVVKSNDFASKGILFT